MDLFEVAVQQARVQELSLAIREKIAEQIADAPADTLLFVNLHPLILEDQGFLDGEGPLRPFADRIVFEITERNAIPDFRRYREHLNRIESYGFSFAVDDLGSGYASLNAVSMLRPKYLKLDRALIHGIAHSPQQRSLVSRIMDFARESDIAVVAEGIEERSEAEEVMKLGCDMLQGFYFAKPTAQFLSVNIEGHIRSVSWRGLELVLLPFFSVFGIF